MPKPESKRVPTPLYQSLKRLALSTPGDLGPADEFLAIAFDCRGLMREFMLSKAD